MLKPLIALRFGSLFSGGEAKNGKKSRFGRIGIIGLISFLVLLFAFYFLMVADALAMLMVPLGFSAEYFAIFNLLAFTLIFILSIFETKSALFECRDNELLLSMPVRPRDIVLSRAITVLLMNVGEALLVGIPAVIMFVYHGGGAWYIPSALLTFILISLLASALSSAVGYLVARISAYFRGNTLVTVILSFGFLAAYFAGYMAFMDAMMSFEENPDGAADSIASTFGGLAIVGDISLAKPLNLSIFIVISLGFALLAWYIISKNYTKIITARVSGKKKEYRAERLQSSSTLIALSKKEISAFLSNSAYILNGTMGAIFQIVIGVMLLTSGGDASLIFDEIGLGITGDDIAVVVGALLIGVSSLTSISASALSLEGDNFWIIKSSPIRLTDVVYAKLVPHLMISLPASLISSVLVAIAIGASPLWWIYIVGAPLVGCFVFAMLGLVLNIAMPKLKFRNATEVIKQSAPVFILTLGGMLLSAVFVIGSFLLSLLLGALLAAIIISLFILVIFLVLYIVLSGPSLKKLAKI